MPIQPRTRTIEGGKKVINQFNYRFYWAKSAYSGVINRLTTYSLYSKIRVSRHRLTLSGWRRSPPRSSGRARWPCGRPGPRRFASRWRWRSWGKNAGIGINAFPSVYIYSVRRKKMFFSLHIILHISVVYGPYVEPNKRVVQYPLGNF